MKYRTILTASLIVAMIFTGCGTAANGTSKGTQTSVVTSGGSTEADDTENTENTENNDTETTENTESDEDSSSESGTVDLLADFSEEDQFTERDLSGDYDASEAETITFSDGGASSESKGVSIDGSTVTISEEGVYILSGSCSDGMVIVDADKSAKIQLVLNGVTLTSQNSAAVYVKQADKVFLTLADGTKNVLSSGSSYTAIDENNIDAAIFSKDDLTLNGTGSLTIESPAGHGIVSKDDLVIADGTYTITAAQDTISGKDSVRIAGGNFTLDAGDDGIRSGKDDAGYIYIRNGSFQIKTEGKGLGAGSLIYVADGDLQIDAKDDDFHSNHSVYVGGGDFALTTEDDAFHADNMLKIAGGKVDISKSYEGLEAEVIDISGGEIYVTASDDGVNSAGGNDGSSENSGFGKGDMFAVDEDATITISGGKLYISAEGDGVDSNGSILITGGETYVTGPTNSGNGSLDYNGEAVIQGGIFVAADASGMAENFSDSSTQGSMLVSTGSQSAGSKIQLLDSSGKTLVEWTSEKSFDCVVISIPEVEKGQTYTLKAGTYSEEITMDSLIYGAGSGMGGGRGGHGGMNGGPGSDDQTNGDQGSDSQTDGGFRKGGPGSDGQTDGNFGENGSGKGFRKGGRPSRGGMNGGQEAPDSNDQTDQGSQNGQTEQEMTGGTSL